MNVLSVEMTVLCVGFQFVFLVFPGQKIILGITVYCTAFYYFKTNIAPDVS